MHDAEERVGEILLVVARGQPAILRPHLGAERMHRRVDAAGLEIEAHALRHAAVEALLRRGGIIRLEPRRDRPTRSPCAGAGSSGASRACRSSKSGARSRDARARFVGVEQRVVGAILVAPAIGLLADEAEDFFQPRREGGEVRGRARLRPMLAGQRRGAGDVLDQARGKFRRAVVVAAPFAHVGVAQLAFEIVGAGRHGVLARLQPVADLRARWRADASGPRAGRVARRGRPRPSAACRSPGPTRARWPCCCNRPPRASAGEGNRTHSSRSTCDMTPRAAMRMTLGRAAIRIGLRERIKAKCIMNFPRDFSRSAERRAWIATLLGPLPETRWDALARELFAWQFARVPEFRRLCEGHDVTPATLRSWRDIPAMPQQLFKRARLFAHGEATPAAIYETSGTTTGEPGRQHLLRTDIYEAVVDRGGAPRGLFRGCSRFPFHRRIAARGPSFLAQCDVRILESCRGADTEALRWTRARSPNCAASSRARGTRWRSAEQRLDLSTFSMRCAARLPLPRGSRLLETGGFKGRSREIPKPELYAQLARTFGVPDRAIWNEYGMSELSSQAYAHGTAGLHATPPWARVLVVDPATGREVPVGREGLVRWIDLANVDSVLCAADARSCGADRARLSSYRPAAAHRTARLFARRGGFARHRHLRFYPSHEGAFIDDDTGASTCLRALIRGFFPRREFVRLVRGQLGHARCAGPMDFARRDYVRARAPRTYPPHLRGQSRRLCHDQHRARPARRGAK